MATSLSIPSALVFLAFVVLVSSEITTFTNFLRKELNPSGLQKVSVFYVHDWNTKGLTKAIEIKDAILKNRTDVSSVVMCDWTTFSRIPDYHNVAKKYTSRVASEIWNQIESLQLSGSRISVECIGHGLGAHICGQVGKLGKQNDKVLQKITGLDPTGPYFKDHRAEGLEKSDARVVEAIHTDKRYGIYEKIGHIDTFPKITECDTSRLLKKNQCLHNSVLDEFLRMHSTQAYSKSRKVTHSMAILTLDVSPSMQNFQRIQNTITASKRLINSLPDGFSLGIVLFGGTATESLPPTVISAESRALIGSKLPEPTTSIPSTSIGAGILKALDSLAPYLDKDGYCPDIILVTDGDENEAPNIKDVQPKLNSSKLCTRVHTIALGPEADVGLEALSNSTGGQAHFSGDASNADTLAQSLISASSAQIEMKDNANPIQLPAKEVELSPDGSASATFAFDEGIGSNTTFFISASNPDLLTAELIAPNGEVYGNASYTTEADLQGLLFKLLDIQPGNWTIKLNPRQTRRRKRALNTGSQKATVFVTTYPTSDGVDRTVRLEAYLSNTILDGSTNDLVAVEAYVSRGTDPIVEAIVYGVITSSDGTTQRIELLDNGMGSDEEKDDGVYTRYITNLKPGNRYAVEVFASSNPNGTTSVATLNEDPFLAPNKNDWTPLNYTFERQRSAGSFQVAANFKTKEPKPSPVKDLKVSLIDVENRTCTLEWTNPEEEVAPIQLRVFDLKNNGLLLTENDVIEGSLKPNKPGSVQVVKVKIPKQLFNTTEDEDDNSGLNDLFFTVQTVGKDGRLSVVSNIAPVGLLIDPVVETAETEANVLLIVLVIVAVLIVLILAGLAYFQFVRRRNSANFRVKHSNSQRI